MAGYLEAGVANAVDARNKFSAGSSSSAGLNEFNTEKDSRAHSSLRSSQRTLLTYLPHEI